MPTVRRKQLTAVKSTAMVLSRVFRAFLVDRTAQQLAARTLQYYRSEIQWFLTWLEEERIDDLRDVTPDHLRRWLVALGTHRSAGGVHANYRALRAFLRWAWEEYEPVNVDGDLLANPIERVKAPKLPQELLPPVELGALAAMLATCARKTFTGDRDYALLLALLDTGCRAEEFLSLNLADVNLETGDVIIRQGKGGKDRVTYLSEAICSEVERYLDSHRQDAEEGDPLWVTDDKQRMAYQGLRAMVKRRAIAAGVAVPALHDFRRGYATYSVQNGADLSAVQQGLGHSSLNVTQRYLNRTRQELRAAHERISPAASLTQKKKRRKRKGGAGA